MSTSRTILTVFVAVLCSYCSCKTKSDPTSSLKTSKPAEVSSESITLDGLYTGLEEMCASESTGRQPCAVDPDRPDRKWFHFTYLKIKGDSVYADQSPISIGSKKDTLWSSSDGAFYYYSGTIQRKGTTVLFNLKALFCDYCAVPFIIKPDGTREIIKRKKQLSGRLTDNGIVINGYLFTRQTKNQELISEHPAPYL